MVADYTVTTVARQIWEELSKNTQYQIILKLSTSIRLLLKGDGISSKAIEVHLRGNFCSCDFTLEYMFTSLTLHMHDTRQLEQTMKPDDDDEKSLLAM